MGEGGNRESRTAFLEELLFIYLLKSHHDSGEDLEPEPRDGGEDLALSVVTNGPQGSLQKGLRKKEGGNYFFPPFLRESSY